jgi:hypothetical protein
MNWAVVMKACWRVLWELKWGGKTAIINAGSLNQEVWDATRGTESLPLRSRRGRSQRKYALDAFWDGLFLTESMQKNDC